MKTTFGLLCVVAIFVVDDPQKKPAATSLSLSRVQFTTDLCDFIVELETDRAPKTSANFLAYVDRKLYDRGAFHRTVTKDNQPNTPVKIEVVQAAADLKREKQFPPAIPLERTSKTRLRHLAGTISMARDGPDTGRDEFFICLSDQPELDFGGKRNPDGQGFAAFGRVVDGMETIKKIHQSKAKEQSLTPKVMILKARRLN
jgi:peptidyl-prolyl cis-trans isomerase A (cyclophilin A)